MNTNKLKVTDLMVGDWVSCQINSIEFKYVRIASLNKTTMNGIPTDFIEFNKVSVDMLHGNYYQVDIASVHPVPLTPEILEKNGFEKEGVIELYNLYAGIDHRVTIHDNKEYMNSNNEWYVHVDSEDYSTIAGCELTYLHELQHILRLCKISKEIVV
jgi:hypothetical protein